MANRYIPYTWVNNESIANATRLNAIEEGIEAVDSALNDIEEQIANGEIGGNDGDADTLGGHPLNDFLLMKTFSSTTSNDIKTVLQNNRSNIPNGITALKIVAQSYIAFAIAHYSNGQYRVVLDNEQIGTYDAMSSAPSWVWKNLKDGGNAATVNGKTVESSVPANAKFSPVVVYVQEAQPTSPSTGDLWIW